MNRLVSAAVLLVLAGCNTVEGFGRDLQTIGGVVTGTATGMQNAATAPSQPLPPDKPIVSDTCEPDSNGLVLEGCPKQQ